MLSHDPWAVPTGTSWNPDGYNWTTSMMLDGEVGHVATADPVLRTDNSFTVSAWVRLGSRKGHQTAVSQDGTYMAGFRLYYHQTTDRYCLTMYHRDEGGSGPSRSCSANAAQLDTWTHLAGVFDMWTETLTLYVDGQPQETVAYAWPTHWQASGPLAIGRSLYTTAPGELTYNATFWDGAIDNVRTYQGAMTATQVWDLYNE
jgi:hypothetical protein